jgi:glycosyltransferase involved in cell wall biosynthesis
MSFRQGAEGELSYMKLVIDCFKLVKGSGKSIGIYNLALNLVREIARGDKAKTNIIVLGNSYNKADFDIDGVNFVDIKKNPLNKLTCIIWELFEVSIIAKKMGADKVLFPRGYASMLHLTEEYVIIHDMIPFYYNENYPSYFNKLENFYIMWRLKASARKADKVITISEASKRDIIKYSKTNDDRIVVINNGYNQILKKEYVKAEKSYILAITSDLPHKNAIGIAKSYEEYCKVSGNPLPLTIIGIENLSGFGIEKTVADNITCIKYVGKNEELHQIIYGAKVFLFLSLAEGFGFPPIEAMQLGTPVICSNRSSLPEVVGDAAVLVNPEDYKKVGETIAEVLDESFDTESLCRKGLINVDRFNWTISGDKYRKVLGL